MKVRRLSELAAASIGFSATLLLIGKFLDMQSAAFQGELNPSFVILAAGSLLSIWTILGRGTKHPPFWLTLGFAVTIILLSLNYWGSTAIPFLRNEALALIGLGLIVVSRIVSRRVSLNFRRYAVLVLLFSFGAAAGLSALMPQLANSSDLSYSEGRDALVSLLHPGAGDFVEDIDSYVDHLLEDDELDLAAKEAVIRSLNERIASMEAELAIFESTREQHEAHLREIESLRLQVAAAETLKGVNSDDIQPVAGFDAAVRPEIPMVRDFAVTLASKTPGTYYREDGDRWAAGTDGVKQIVGIHRYISGEWKYVNDPAQTARDFYSPAHRTLAAGLAGDCDDYAILISSAIEAVGGKTRIMGGSCNSGYHAWPEVYIGKRAAFNEAMSVLSRAYPGRTIQYLKDSTGGYWLCLDWQLGVYSCGRDARVLYQRIGGVS